MNKQHSLAKARKGKRPVLLFDSKRYSIIKIPLNYKILIKLNHKKGHRTINRDFYCPIEEGISYSHKVAEQAIKNYFKE